MAKKDKDEITYEDVRAGRQEIEAQRAVTEAAVQSAIVRYGIIKKPKKKGKLDRKVAAEKANEIADYVEGQLLKKGDHNPLYEDQHAEIAKKKTSQYGRIRYLNEKYGFDRGTFIQAAIDNGLSKEQIERILNALFEHKESVHRSAATGDVHFANLDDKIKEVEKEGKVEVATAHRGNYRKMTGLIYAHRAGQLGPYVEQTPGITKVEKKKAA